MTGHALMNGSMVGGFAWRTVQRIPDGEIEFALVKGRVDFANGERGTYAGVETVDFRDARVPFSGHRIVMLADGSMSNQSFEGWTEFQEISGRVVGNGTWRMLDGTGRFAGLTGGGTFHWELDSEDYRETFSG
jgi:hypothetical protein